MRHIFSLRQNRDVFPIFPTNFLAQYQWPVNVRDSQNLIQRLVIMADRDQAMIHDLPAFVVTEPENNPMSRVVSTPEPLPLSNHPRLSLNEIERSEIESALKRHGWG